MITIPKHTEYIREVPDSKTAVLFIHGILGTPHHFHRLVEVVPEEWSVYNILLEGHGKTVDDFAGATMEQWKRQVHRLIIRLNRKYDNIIITAHSMGTLFAVEEAVKNPKVKSLFLLNVPLKVHLYPKTVMDSLKIIFERVKPDDKAVMAVRDAYSITPDKHLWKYLRWIPNYLDLFAEIKRARKCVSQIKVPCFVFYSKKDELVAASSVKYFRENPHIRCKLLTESGHFYYEEADMEAIIKGFKKLRGGFI